MYDLFLDLPPAVVPRFLRIPVDERTRYDGKVLRAPEPAEIEPAIQRLVTEQVDSVAVCFIHAYANPENEQRVAEMLRRHLPGLAVSLSSEVLSEIGEYGRFSTTAINAYVQPLVAPLSGAAVGHPGGGRVQGRVHGDGVERRHDAPGHREAVPRPARRVRSRRRGSRGLGGRRAIRGSALLPDSS